MLRQKEATPNFPLQRFININYNLVRLACHTNLVSSLLTLLSQKSHSNMCLISRSNSHFVGGGNIR